MPQIQPLWRGLAVCAVLLLCSRTAHAANLISNGSFESGAAGWGYSGTLDIRSLGSIDGTWHAGVGAELWQDVATQPGKSYYIQFWTKGSVPPGVTFGGVPLSLSSPTNVWFSWYAAESYAVASTRSTRLSFSSGILDAVRVIATDEPVRIVSQPVNREGVEGASAAFNVVVDGGPPFRYAWRFNAQAIPDGTNQTLLLTRLKASDAGAYSVIVSNTMGSVTSAVASLNVQPLPKVPTIVSQPTSDSCAVGYSFTVAISALGSEPLQYQWMRHGTNVPDATNRVLILLGMQVSDSGTYNVRVENNFGSTVSLPAEVNVTAELGGGYINFNNVQSSSRAPIYDVDGSTRLAGSNYVAQLYAGRSETTLRPLGTPKAFYSGSLAGFFSGGPVVVPNVPIDAGVYVQTRAWEAAAGVSYEDARARGGKYGAGPIFLVTTVSPPPAVPVNVPMVSFRLRAGSPLFSTGKLEVNTRSPNDRTIEWKLTGAAGARYLIEKRTPPQNWIPFVVLTNETGTAFFHDADGRNSINFYRSRMLD